MLGIEQLRYYDIYPPIIEANTGVCGLKRSEEITIAALAPFAQECLGMLRTGLDGDWMHSHPQESKQSGAYVNGAAYDVHPDVLLNHNDDYESLLAFAREWGHAIHTMLANKAQPFEKANYSNFTAEMASIISEIQRQERMIANARNQGGEALLSWRVAGARARVVLPADDVRRVRADDPSCSGEGRAADGGGADADLWRPLEALSRPRPGRDDDRRWLCAGVGAHPALLRGVPWAPVRDLDFGRDLVCRASSSRAIPECATISLMC